MTISSRVEPCVVYGLYHPGLGAIKVGMCLEPRTRRIGQFTRKGWLLVAEYPAPTAMDAEQIEETVTKALTPRVWWGWRGERPGLPWHYQERDHCALCGRSGGGPGTPRLDHIQGGFLTREQVPQGGAGETFDVRLVSPQRLQLAIFYAEQNHRARYYPARTDGLDPEEIRRTEVSAYWARWQAHQRMRGCR
ncbi:hypothetical protein ACPC54_18520 [Kitasatospora sp. NPDC094028]